MATRTEIVELIAKHLPPSADRVRVYPLDAQAREWAHALAEEHFAEVCEEGECDAALGADLSLLSQVALRPGGRAIFLLHRETRSLPELGAILATASLTRILTEAVLDGEYVLARGEPRSGEPERNGVILSSPDTAMVLVPAGKPLPRYVHLLIHQYPPSRGWEQPDLASVAWDALTVRYGTTGQLALLGFTSLVKAVAFTKPAVLAGVIQHIDKMPRYPGKVVAQWGVSVLMNSAFERLREDARYEFGSAPLRIDPRLADLLHE